MSLSKESVAALSDLIENKLAIMTIDDRDDLREMVALKRALIELQGTAEDRGLKAIGEIPRRGRRRKVSSMLAEEQAAQSA
ncbi:MAG TPA: hypothetical protein VFR09_02960 [Alphaproteobacteria bacterium]|nr:hypothetical protein [Alphaproteobacteria bacterium]